MSFSIIAVGESLVFNEPFKEYLNNILREYILESESIHFLDKNDNDFFIKLEEILDRSKSVIILSHSSSYNFVNKVLATLNDDRLELKEDMLIPSKTTVYTKNSYIIDKNETVINSIKICEGEEIPQILISPPENTTYFTIIGIDTESIKILLSPLTSTYEIKITATQIVDGWSVINAKANKYGDLQNFIKAVKSLFNDKFIKGRNITEHIVKSLIKHDKKISVVESCTGGLISSMLTKQPGVSAVFDGGMVSYSNDMKRYLVGVSKETLENFGAVSEACVKEMLEGIMNVTDSDYALAVSGIAGPNGGTKEKPVGTVFIGAKSKEGNYIVERLLFKGDREYIQIQSAHYAFKLLLQLDKEIFF